MASAIVVVFKARPDGGAVGAAEMFRVSDAAAVSGVVNESVTTKVTGYAPVNAGVPESVPDAERLIPVGKLPDCSDQLYGGTPPEACNVVEE